MSNVNRDLPVWVAFSPKVSCLHTYRLMLIKIIMFNNIIILREAGEGKVVLLPSFPSEFVGQWNK